MTAPLRAARAEIATFVDAMFPYATDGTVASLRAFHEGSTQAFAIRSIVVRGARGELIDEAVRLADRAATAPQPVVVCPPIATFASRDEEWRAREIDLANGLALTVECDQHPGDARRTLERLLGPATAVVLSGGIWTDPDTGEVLDKLHLHWRLTEPTTEAKDHARLKAARRWAMVLVGGDPTNVPMVHPIRWPGTVHRKSTPRLARLTALDAGREIDLGDTLELLEIAGQQAGLRIDVGAGGPGERSDGRDIAELVRMLVTGESLHSPLATLGMRLLLGGVPDHQAVLLLRGMMEAVPAERRAGGLEGADRWQVRYDDIPRAVSTARAKVTPHADPRQPTTEWPRVEGEHRKPAVANIAGRLLRHGLDAWLALDLAASWNAAHCVPPLDGGEVAAVVDYLAGREAKHREARHARR